MEHQVSQLEQRAFDHPDDAQALVSLANAYWLQGRGPEVVQDLATRAMAADPDNHGAWHLWALSESSPRERVRRWRQIVERFPADQLARASLADNAASLAGADMDADALALAIITYEQLLGCAETAEQREAVAKAIEVLKRWRF